MLEFGQAQPAGADVIKDVTDQTFMADVVEASREFLSSADFWAPWCGLTAKTTGPQLERRCRPKGHRAHS